MSAASPVSSLSDFVVRGGDVVVSLPNNQGPPDNLRSWPVDRPSAAALDLQTGDWLTLPGVPPQSVSGVSFAAWTPYGPVVFWSAQSRTSSGAILRPTTSAR
jgi:hypothetical protein